jgi:hypothetical protein
MKIESIRRRLLAVVFVLVGVLFVPTTWSDILNVTEHQITSSPGYYETTPSLGNDGVSDLVVYAKRELLAGGALGPGDIFYQRLANGAPDGAAVQVTFGDTDDQLNDVSGDWIVYTAYDSVMTNSGAIMVYQISEGIRHTLGTATIIQEPKIHGNRVVWREGGVLWATVMYYELIWIGQPGYSPRPYAGPEPPTFDIQLGSRFVVWAELDGGTYDVYAYDFTARSEVRVTDTPAVNERRPATSGDWIAWQREVGSVNTIGAKQMSSHQTVTIANGAGNFNPSADGDLIAWETDVAGNLDIWLYRISEGQSYAVTTDPTDQYLNDVFGDLVAYVDMRDGSEDIYVSTLQFMPDHPCEGLGGDTDGDGVCDNLDNCPLVTNPDQSNSDPDAFGDACDNCPTADNPIQECSDNTDCIGVSNTCIVSTGFCSAQNDNDGDGAGDFCDLDDDNDEIPDVDDNCPLVANGDQADADSDGLGDVCDDTFTNSTVVTEIISAGNAAVELITNLNPPGGNGLIAKLTGDDGVVTIVDAAASAYEAGTIDLQAYLSELELALARLDAFDNQLAAKIKTGKINEPEATELTGISASIRQAINDLIANAGS